MTINKEWLKEYCNKMRYSLTEKQEQYILYEFSNEPDKYNCWTEQDIYEQIRKILHESKPLDLPSKVVNHE